MKTVEAVMKAHPVLVWALTSSLALAIAGIATAIITKPLW